MDKGFFITFEGGEGCGKSTHIKRLSEYFKSKGRECVVSREPGGTSLGEKIREILLHAKEGIGMSPRTELLLFEAARAQHVDELIIPALRSGKIVICDRFADSSEAYQGAARKLTRNDVKFLNDFAVSGVKPDLTIVLDLSPDVGLNRARTRDSGNADRMGSENLSFYEDVRNAFLKLAKENPDRIRVVDSSGSQNETFSEILKAVEEKMNGI